MEAQRREYRRDPKGTSTGGQFTVTTGSAPSKERQGRAPRRVQEQVAPAASRRFTTLSRDDDNDAATVKELQQVLTALGMGSLKLDGKFGPNTEAAVKAAQRRLGLKPTGKASKTLVNKLLNAYDLSPCVKRSEDPMSEYDILRAVTEEEVDLDEDLEDLLAGLSDDEVDELGALAEEGGDE